MSSPVRLSSSPVTVSDYDSVTRGVLYFSRLSEFSDFCANTEGLTIVAYNKPFGKKVYVEKGEDSVYESLRKTIASFPVNSGPSYNQRQVNVVALKDGVPIAESGEVTLGVRLGR